MCKAHGYLGNLLLSTSDKTLKNIFQWFDVSLLDNIGKSYKYFIRLTKYFPVFYAKCIKWSVSCAVWGCHENKITGLYWHWTETIKLIPLCFRIFTINWVFFSLLTFVSHVNQSLQSSSHFVFYIIVKWHLLFVKLF